MLNTYTVSFFGHRQIERPFEAEERLEKIIRELIRSKEYVEFLVGRNGEFDQMAVFDLAKILEEIHWEEYAEFDNPPHCEASPEFKQKMQERLDRGFADER